MMRTSLLSLCAAALAMGIAACGSDTKQRDCAAGTIADPTGANQCVPDGTVICGDGTTYDMASGKCVAGGQCPQGQVLVNGSCTANVTPDAEEGAEPNDTASAGTITVPAVGAKGYVVHGCITPRDTNMTADQDPWMITVTGPTLLDVTADGVGGLAAGFVAVPASPELQPLVDAGWQRFGVNLVDDTSHRQLYLPAAGTYALIMSDSRALFLQDAVAGSDQSCYFTTVTQLAIPAPTPLTAPLAGTIGGDVQFYSVTPEEGDLIDAVADMPSNPASSALVLAKNSAYFASAAEDSSGTPAELFDGGLKASDQVTIVLDTVYNYAIAPQDFTLTVTPVHAQALPTNGTVTVTDKAGSWQGGDPLGNMIWLYFDVAHDGDIVHFDETFQQDANFVIVDSSTAFIANVSFPGNPALTGFTDWVRFEKAGRYYAVLLHPGATAGATSTITSKLAAVQPAALAIGTPVTNQTLPALGADWFSVDPSAQKWIATNASATSFGGQVNVTYFPQTGSGRFGTEIQPVIDYNFNPNGSQTFGRITFGDPAMYTVRVQDTGTTVTGAKYSLSIAPQTFVDLGTVNETMPADKTGEDLGGLGKTKYYFFQGNTGDKITITIHPAATLKATATWLNVDQSARATATAALGADVTLTASVGKAKFIAFAVTGTGTPTTYDVHVVAAAPKNYTMATGTLPFTDICNGGANEVTMTDNDEGLSSTLTMPFAWTLFGDSVSTYKVSTNGFLSFSNLTDSFYANASIPDEAAPNAIVAPYWSDLMNVVVCKTQDANKVTLQWTGDEFGLFGPGRSTEFQVTLHKDGSIDYIWGANQAADGDPSTVGLENTFGTFGKQVTFNQAGTVHASTSLTFTPVP